jgi:hypothetical protein
LVRDRITLWLNGVEIYQCQVDRYNQRLFGFLHYADKTEVRVRNVKYQGQWQKRLPGGDELVRAPPIAKDAKCWSVL